MTAPNNSGPLPGTCDVVIVGGGPSGLAAATHLKQSGIGSVLVLEREPEAGGIPRHCGHPPFGMREFHSIKTGPRYAKALVERAEQAGVEIWTNTTVTHIHEGGRLSITTDAGCSDITADRVILCTGVRETPRSTRLVTGARPLGIFNTGALQSMVYLKDRKPFRRPVIIGTELVSFSALLTCRHAGIKPVAMIETNAQVTARTYCRLLPALLGVSLHLNTSLAEVIGKDRVYGVRIVTDEGRERIIDCDGVLFTGQFTPESSLLRMGHLSVDQTSGGPIVDQFGRCSDPVYFATGNLLRPVETAGWCWNEGRKTAAMVVQSLAGQLPDQASRIPIVTQGRQIKYTVPQILSVPVKSDTPDQIQLRFRETATGKLSVQSQGKTIWSRQMTGLPERRVLIPLSALTPHLEDGVTLDICFTEKG